MNDFLKIRRENGDSKVITGNTECGVETKLRGLLYPNLISPVAVPELNKMNITTDSITVGAATTLNEIDRNLKNWMAENKDNPRYLNLIA